MSPLLPSLLAALALILPTITLAQTPGATPVDPDPEGVRLKPIPDKLIVLTFDDGPASHATVVAPILKSLGFGGTIYVCNFDSFPTRKDWYQTWRQMIAMNADGLEIGNHTRGHGGGLENFLRMEDELLANGGPKMTTVCWPIYNVVWPICPALTANGYTFGRGGHERPYRPTIDHPFDVPSFSVTDGLSIESFIKKAQMACEGRVVVFCFHGVPDMEHPPVSLEPATFKVMMDYLKKHHYTVIAMRDMAKYVDPAKATRLPRTANVAKDAPPFLSIKDDEPFVAPPEVALRGIAFPGLPPVNRAKDRFTLTAPYGTDLTKLAPKLQLSEGATVTPASDSPRDFSQPQTYTVTASNGTSKTYLVTLQSAAPSPAKEMSGFTLPNYLPNTTAIAISKNQIGVHLPPTADLRALAPTFTVSPFATATPPSGTVRDFTKPQSYTITAQDSSTQIVTVMIAKNDQPTAFTWSKTTGGNWSDPANWTNNLATGTPPATAGHPDYLLRFNQPKSPPITNDFPTGFTLNQLAVGELSGGLILTGNPLTFTKDPTKNIPPAILAAKCQQVNFNLPIVLRDDLSIQTSTERDPNCFLTFNETISGPHSLILESSGDPQVAKINFHDVHFGILQINHSNTYSGGTQIHGGKINVRKSDGLGTGPISIHAFGTLSTENPLPNPLTILQGTLFHCSLTGPVTLKGTAHLISNCTLAGDLSGPGGLTHLGTNGTYLSMIPGGTLTLEGTNSYTGPTIIFPGTLIVKKAASLYRGDPTQWTTSHITIHQAATLHLFIGGPGEFTGPQVGSLLGNLTTNLQQNGLMGGAILALNTTTPKEITRISTPITDSQGPGGGPFLIKKSGPGSLELSGKNTYTGQTILQSGALRVSSLNSFTKGLGKPTSSLGAPTNIEAAEILIGEEDKDGEASLIYTGTGETTDRVLNLAGKISTVTLDHSGTGLLKFSTPILLSGYGAHKTLILQGDTAGTGEIAGPITNPHDRNAKAVTALTKSGTGTWTLSGSNAFTGPTKVTAGTLALSTPKSLSPKTSVDLSTGATLELNFSGEMPVRLLSFDGVPQPAGSYDAKNSPKFIKGKGVLKL